MPHEISILENKVLGREYRRGELAILRRQIEFRFGNIPDRAEEKLNEKSAPGLEKMAGRLFDADSLEELLG